MNSQWMARARTWFAAPVEGPPRPEYRRLPVPFTFKPELSFGAAMIGALGAFLRIFLGSILFGVYGWNSMVAWNGIRSPYWRLAAIPAMVVVFLLLMALLMAAISALVRRLTPRL